MTKRALSLFLIIALTAIQFCTFAASRLTSTPTSYAHDSISITMNLPRYDNTPLEIVIGPKYGTIRFPKMHSMNTILNKDVCGQIISAMKQIVRENNGEVVESIDLSDIDLLNTYVPTYFNIKYDFYSKHRQYTGDIGIDRWYNLVHETYNKAFIDFYKLIISEADDLMRSILITDLEKKVNTTELNYIIKIDKPSYPELHSYRDSCIIKSDSDHVVKGELAKTVWQTLSLIMSKDYGKIITHIVDVKDIINCVDEAPGVYVIMNDNNEFVADKTLKNFAIRWSGSTIKSYYFTIINLDELIFGYKTLPDYYDVR